MATRYSTQYAQVMPPAYAPLQPNEREGRVRVAYAKYTVVAGQTADGDVIYMLKLPKGARVVGGSLVTDGFGTSVVGKLGTVADDDRYVAASTALANAATAAVANTAATFFCDETTAEVDIVLTLSGAAPTATKSAWLTVLYVVD